MTANATITRDTLHSYSPARGVGVIERIKAEHEAQQFPSQLIPDHVQFAGYHHPSQYPISPPLSREGTRTDTKYNLVAPSQYKSEVSPLDYPHVSGGVMPSEGPDDDALEEEFSEPPRKRRKTQRKKKKPVAPEHMFALEATLSEIASTKGFAVALLDKTRSHVSRSIQVRRKEPRTKRTGKPKRPLNSFILYRSTYRCLVQELRCLEKNEQNISRLCASSWNLESEAIQEMFDELADIDSYYHGKAFPGYKYAPSKSSKGDDEPVKGRASTKTGRVTRNRKAASKTKKLHHLSEEVLQRAIDEQEQQHLPAEAVHHQPYLTSVAVQPHSALYAGGYEAEYSYVVYPDPDQYQRHCIATYGDVYSLGRISPPVVVHALYEDTENPNGNHNEGFIDPKLLLDQSGMHNSTSCSVAIQQRSQPAPIERSRAETGMSSWESDVYAPFLSGRDGDWEVVKLDKREPNYEQLDGSESNFFGDALMAQAQEV